MTKEDHSLRYPTSPLLSSKHTKVMEKLKTVFLMYANSDPDSRLSPSQIALIQHQLLVAFPEFHTPTHPTYSAMIESAIKKLNEEDGSNEESISKYIKENYDGLPWAHNIYLSHHLNELCKTGEVVCTLDKFYTTLALIRERNLRKEQPKRRLGGKRKECVIEDEGGNSGGEKAVEMSRNLTGVQEEDTLVFARSRVKRRKQIFVVDDEDDEVAGAAVVGEEKNVNNNGQNLVVPLEDGDDFTGRISGLSEEWGGIGAVGEAEDHDIVNVPIEYVACEGKTEPKLSLVPSSVGILQAECDEKSSLNMHDDRDAECDEKSSLNSASVSNIRIDALELDVKESVMKENDLQIAPFEGNSPITVVSAGINPISEGVDLTMICGLACPKLEQPKPKQQVYFAKKRLKACNVKKKVSLESMPSFAALSVGQNLLEHNQMHKLSSQRDLETKLCATLLESPKLKELSVGQNQQACTSFLFEDGFIEQLERQNCLDHSNHPSSLEELMSVHYEENLPLQQVLEKCGKRKKHAVQILTVKSPLASEASSISGSKLQVNQPEYENPVRMMPIIVPEATLTKRKEKQQPHQQQQRELKPQVQKHCNFDQGSLLHFELTAETFPSNDDGRDWDDNQQTSEALDFPCESKQSTDITAVASALTRHLNGQKEEWEIDEKVAVDTDLVRTAVMEECQSVEKVAKKPTKHCQGRSPKAISTVDDLLEVPTLSLCHDGMEDQEGKSQCLVGHHDPETGAAPSQKRIVPTLDQSSQQLINQSVQEAKEEATKTSLLLQHQCHWQQKGPLKPASILNVEGTYSRTCQIDKIKSHELETDGFILCPEVASLGFVATGHVGSDNPQSMQKRHKRQLITRLSLSDPFLHNSKHKIEDQEGQSQDNVRLQELEATTAAFAEDCFPNAYQKDEEQIKQVKRELRRRSQKQLEVNKEDVVPSSNALLQHQRRMSKPATHWNLKQQGRPREHMEATKGNAVALHSMYLQPEGLSQPAIDHDSHTQIKQRKKDGRGRPRKHIGETKEDKPASLNLNLQPQEELSELAISQDSPQNVKLLEKNGLGRLQKQIEATKQDAEASSNLHLQLLEGSYNLVTDQHSQQQTKQVNEDARRSRRKQRESANEDEVAFSVEHVHPEDVLFVPATHQHSPHKFEPLKKKGRGRPRKQIEASKEDAAASSNLHPQQQVMPSEPSTHHKKDGRGRPRKQNGRGRPRKQNGRGRPRKQKDGTKNDDTASMNLLLVEPERKFQPATYQYSQLQNKLRKREGRGGFQKQKETLEAPKQTVLLELATCKESKQFEKDHQGRPWNQQVHKEDSAIPLSLFHHLEDGLSDQEKECKVDDCPDAEPEKSQKVHKNLSNKMRHPRSLVASVPSDDESPDQHNQHVGPNAEPEKSRIEIQGTPEIRQAMQPSNIDSHRWQEKKLHSGSQLPKTGAPSTPSDIQRDQQQEEQCFHEHEEKLGKFEGQARLPKGKLAKNSMIQVPLSSKNQLRSRIKQQS